MTAPDNDVRPWRRPTPAKPGGTGRFALARLLLHVLDHLRQLDRKLLLLLAASSLSACIIPVGPEFQDPLGVPNSAPQILDPIPTWGATVTATPMGFTFRITVTDANNDPLFIRFLVDGDIVAIQRTMVPRSNTGELRETVENQITCLLINNPISKAKSQHLVLAAVADRMFDQVTDPLAVPIPGRVSSPITWTLNMTCPVMMSPGSSP